MSLKEEAEMYLGYLREGSEHYDYWIECIRDRIMQSPGFREGRFTLEDIGTNEKELEELKVKGCKISAQEWLGCLRQDASNSDELFDVLRGEIKKGGLSLEDIGTSEKELEELRIKGCKLDAQDCLECLRKSPLNHSCLINYLRKKVQSGGFTLDDIGTSEKELEELRSY